MTRADFRPGRWDSPFHCRMIFFSSSIFLGVKTAGGKVDHSPSAGVEAQVMFSGSLMAWFLRGNECLKSRLVVLSRFPAGTNIFLHCTISSPNGTGGKAAGSEAGLSLPAGAVNRTSGSGDGGGVISVYVTLLS
jgi:hypothetical protein